MSRVKNFLALCATALATMGLVGAVIVGIGGIYLLRYGFQNVIFAYLGACTLVALISTIYVAHIMDHPSSDFYSRFT